MKINTLTAALKRNHILKYVLHKVFKTKAVFSKENILQDCIFYKQEFPFINYQTSEFEPAINSLFNKWAFSGELEYLVHYQKKGLLEPHYGWFLNSNDEVIVKSLPYGETGITALPNYIIYVKRKIIRIKSAVSIRYNWFNYWHFYNDVLGQLYLLDKHNFDKKVPIIIPKEALKLDYVQQFFLTEYSKRWNWIFQERDIFIELESVYFCKSIPNIKDHFLFASNIFRSATTVNKSQEKKLFITRKLIRGRTIINIDEIISLLKQYEFEIIDSDDFSLNEQIDIFSSAETIIGIHGAGLTNMIYRYPEKCTLIEIFPPDMTPTHYYWLSKELGFNYNAVLGVEGDRNSFSVNKNQFEITIKSFEKNEPWNHL